MNKTVTIFGSSLPREGDKEYEAAYKLGSMLGAVGLHVCSGGYYGIMEAVSKGAYENDTDAIGVTLQYMRAEPNEYITKTIVCPSLFERIQKLIELGDAFIILQGGTGTLLELAAVWEYMNKSLMPQKPIGCHSSMWNSIVSVMDSQILKEKRKSGLVTCFEKIEDCAGFVIQKLQ